MSKFKHIQNWVDTLGITAKGGLPTINFMEALELEKVYQLKRIADRLEQGIEVKR